MIDATRSPDALLTDAGQRTGYGRAYGTFGELLQGILPLGHDFLVTLPIALHADAVLMNDTQLSTLIVSPPHKRKAAQLVSAILEHYGLPVAGWLQINSSLPEGKGMASSSADLVASARAVANCYDLPLTAAMIERFMSAIEPTDGVMYDGVTAFLHREVKLYRRLGGLPPLTIVGIDEGSTVDTVLFNKLREPIPDRLAHRYAVLLERLTEAVARADLRGVGAVSTESAQLYQPFNPKRHLDAVMDIARTVDACGTVVGHSGTCVGMILDRRDPDHSTKLARAIVELEPLRLPLIACRGLIQP